jgi:hypothetical protein
MKATLVGTLEKVFPIQQMPNKKFKQDIIVVEPPMGTNSKEKPFLIQNWAETRESLENMQLDEYTQAKVSCDCYWNGYQYENRNHETQYGVRVSLINIKVEN